MPRQDFQIILLRLAAFVIDALAISLALLLPSSIISYSLAWWGGSINAIARVWYVSLAVLVFSILLRDGWRGRSPGKRLLGLELATPSGRPCGWFRSLIRNIPILVPGWNLLELLLVLFSGTGRRTGDRIARTTVVEE